MQENGLVSLVSDADLDSVDLRKLPVEPMRIDVPDPEAYLRAAPDRLVADISAFIGIVKKGRCSFSRETEFFLGEY